MLRRGLLASLGIASLLGACAPAFPPSAAGISGDTEFKARIAARYPPGSSGARLGEDLTREGYNLVAAGGRHEAEWIGDNPPCRSRARVVWREDARGLIRAIGAERHDCS